MFLIPKMLFFCLPCLFINPLLIYEKSNFAKADRYNECRFTRNPETCDLKKFDSNGDGPCIIGRKAGLTRLNGVKVGHVEEVNLGDRTRRRITRAMRPLLFEIPNFLSDEECDYIIGLAEQKQFVSSMAKGGLQSYSELVPPTIRTGRAEGFASYFSVFDLNGDERITLEEMMAFAKKYHYLILTREETLEMLHSINVTEFDDGFATSEEFENMNSMGLTDVLQATVISHPLHRSRYSDQTWVNQRGLRDLMLDKIMERVVELTRLPREIIYGSERLQVVRYGKRGHYHAHFDSETEKRTDVDCCQLKEKILQEFSKKDGCRLCRYVTVLYYLNDVREGGETAFPVADNETLNVQELTASRGSKDYFNLSQNCHLSNLVISPKKGTAVMWYNHLMDEESGWMGARDEYSLHGGCDILQGEKWIANNWITAPYKDGAHIPSSWLQKFDII